jgi:hypothetical protein
MRVIAFAVAASLAILIASGFGRAYALSAPLALSAAITETSPRPNMSLMYAIAGGNGMGRVGCEPVGGQVKRHVTARGTGGDGTSRATTGGCIAVLAGRSVSRRE